MTNWEQHFRQMRPLVTMTKDSEDYSASFGALGGSVIRDDMAAIKAYFVRTKAVTPSAVKIKDDFTKWYDSLWFMTQSDYDLARNMRNNFNLANATSPTELESVKRVIKTGLTAEQMHNEPDRRLSSGMFPGATTPPKTPLFPWWVWASVAVVGGLSLVAYSYGRGTHLLLR